MTTRQEKPTAGEEDGTEAMIRAFRVVGDRPFDEEMAARRWPAFRGFGAPGVRPESGGAAVQEETGRTPPRPS